MSDEGYTVSVVVPTKDRPLLLREALKSIRALEGRGLTFEILVGDNGSTPRTRAIAEEYGAIYIKVETPGSGAARNAAMHRATGDYVAFLDDDDVWTPNHIRGHLALLDDKPELGAVFGQVVNTDARRRHIFGPWPPSLPSGRELLRLMLSGYFPQIGATVVRACVVVAIGDFDESLVGGQDWDWQLRIAASHGIGFVAQTCVLFRQRPPATFDTLQLERLPFTRRIFLRHALRLSLWRSPIDFARAYFGTVTQFLNYFVEAAILRADRGDRLGALRAGGLAVLIFPTRAVRTLLKPTPFRHALVKAMTGRGPSTSRVAP